MSFQAESLSTDGMLTYRTEVEFDGQLLGSDGYVNVSAIVVASAFIIVLELERDLSNLVMPDA